MKNTLFICLFIVSHLFSSPISIDDAEKVALELLNRRNVENKSSYSIGEYSTREVGENILFYVISFEPSGFVIVSGDNRSKPVLGYSFENEYLQVKFNFRLITSRVIFQEDNSLSFKCLMFFN